MQFRDLVKQYDVLKTEINFQIETVIKSGSFISGAQVKEIEAQLATYVGRKHCITCGNGTDALTMAAMVWDIKMGDAVFVPDFTFFSTAEIVSFEGATPIFVDVDENTFNMDPKSLEKAIKMVLLEGILNPRAVIPVDLFGLPADYLQIIEIAKKYGLMVLEDAAQGFGGMLGQKRAGSFGDLSITSFFPAKPLGCYGDGGAIFTDDDETAAYLKSICVHGKGSHKYENIRIGWNSRLDTIQAALLLPKFKAFKEYELDNVNTVAKRYTELLGNIKNVIKTPVIPENYLSSWAQYTIQLENRDTRDKLQVFLKEQGIPTMIYYPIPMHKQKVFDSQKVYLEYQTSINLCEKVLSLPMHPYIDEEDIGRVVEGINDYFNINNIS